jgi:hypothetical protein
MRILRAAVCLFAAAFAAFAQSDRSTMTGTVTDPAGAVVPNVTVQAKNLDTGVVYPTLSTSTGNYTIAELPVGNYELSSTVTGFKRYIRQGLGVQAAQTYRLDIHLEVGAASDSVTITDSVPLLKTESGELAHNITGESLDSLPVLGIGSGAASNSGIRNPYAVAQLLPGGQYTGDVTVRVNGTPQNTSTMRVEGQDSTNTTMTAFGSQNQPSVDSIQEFSVQTSNYAAEFGQAGGAVFIATMKSGNNTYHGSGYDYFVNEALNGATPFVNTRPVARRNDYGFTFGGPVRVPKVYDGHNKTFFFYNFEQFRETQNINDIAITVPTDAYRAGNFQQALTGRSTTSGGVTYQEGQIFDPLSQTAAGRTAFLNNIIPKNRLDPVALAMQSLIPEPTNPTALDGNYLPTWQAIRHTDINSIKVDQIVTSKAKLSVFYSRTHTNSPYSRIVQGDGLPPVISDGRGNYDWVHTTRINFDYTLAPTMLLHIGAGYVNQHGPNDYTPALDSFDPASVGLKGVQNNGRFPNITGLCTAGPAPPNTPQQCTGQGGMITMGPATAGGAPGVAHDHEGIFSFRPTANTSLTWIHGNHTFKAGAEAVISNFMYLQSYPGEGQFAFSAVSTSDSKLFPATTVGGETIGFPYASFLLGAVNSGSVGAPTDQHQSKQSYALFVQDSWKITRKLTVDYGVRYDFLTYLREGQGRQPSFSATVLNHNAGNLPGGVAFDGSLPGRCQCNFASNYPLAIGPRFGVAYQITPKTVFRAGFGVVYAATSAYDNYTISAPAAFSSPGAFTPAMYLASGVQVPIPTWPNFDPGQYPNVVGQLGTLPAGVGYIDQNAGRPPRQLQWSLGVQREFMRNLVVEASFVGNRGAWWPANGLVAYNALTPQILAAHGLNINNAADRTLLLTTFTSGTPQKSGFNIPYASFPLGSTLAQALRPFPQFSSNISGQFAPLGDTWYDSLQVKATKRLSHGLDATYSFTWQKSLTSGAESEGSGGGQANDVFNRVNQKDLSSFDQPLVSILSVNYTTPKASGNKILSWVTRDWTIGGLFEYRSGLPIRVPAAANTQSLANLFFQSTFANRVAGQPLFTHDLNCHCFDPNTQFVLNPAAWVNPPDGQFSVSAPYYSDYRLQRRPTENMSFGRVFRIRERMSLSLRAEFTNILNRTQQSDPSSTSFTAAQTTAGGKTTGGFGQISTSSVFSNPRGGVIVGRFSF